MASVRKRKWTHAGVEKEAWVVAYTDQGGRRRIKTFDKKKDADKHRTKVETEVESGVHIPEAETKTVAQVAEMYLRFSEERVKRRDIQWLTYNIKRRVVDKHLVPALGNVRISELTFAAVEGWHSKMLKSMNPETARHYMFELNQIERFAKKRGITAKLVASEVAREMGRPKIDPIRTFSQSHAVKLFEALHAHHPYVKPRAQSLLRCHVYLAAFCGLRHGEILGLTRGAIDDEAGYIRVRNSLTVMDELKGPKTAAGIRDVPLPKEVAYELRFWLGQYYVANDRDLVFRMPDGGIVKRSTFMTVWHRLQDRAGISGKEDRFHFHALRHFAASSMVEHGLNLKDVASLLGHASFDVTMQVYVHPIVGGQRRQDVFDTMSGALISAARRDKDATTAPRMRDISATKEPKLLELNPQ